MWPDGAILGGAAGVLLYDQHSMIDMYRKLITNDLSLFFKLLSSSLRELGCSNQIALEEQKWLASLSRPA